MALLWNGDAALGPTVFKVLETDSLGSISVVQDSLAGKVWKIHKPVKNHRTEVHAASGFVAGEGDDIYIGWRSKLDIPEHAQTFAVFQWKAYGDNMMQNFPLVFKTLITGEIQLQYATPQKVHIGLWSAPLSRNEWNDFVLHLYISRDPAKGFVEFWYNGVQQQLAGSAARYYGRTLDAGHCDPKWGVYGGDAYTITNYVAALKIGPNYTGVAPKH
ncbi:hypothetical protein BEL04_17540 [Mucilaginibacter sp. PPCGB 2223]|uniref:heparin lyase I family protein n=1 Tax=Mucilaginibacter sp. PPCGB 2223 TaxID=1886027 RepID=UPI0008261E64|nr:heparin lyase I family protein [Mucilaginibacter sp. PPCGB 2223]OCX51815.1 hypothetical protein BEL04_17540 [Mucilaginibacter sp. PPCGB 2223]